MLANAILFAHNFFPISYRSVDEDTYKKALILFYEHTSRGVFTTSRGSLWISINLQSILIFQENRNLPYCDFLVFVTTSQVLFVGDRFG